MNAIPVTRYAKSGDYHIACQVIGQGPADLAFIPGFVSNVETAWDDPPLAHFYSRLAEFARVIPFDKRGTGMTDPVPVQQLPTLEERMDDVRAVMDAGGSARATIIGGCEGGLLALLFAATHPDRTIKAGRDGVVRALGMGQRLPRGRERGTNAGSPPPDGAGLGKGRAAELLFAESVARDRPRAPLGRATSGAAPAQVPQWR